MRGRPDDLRGQGDLLHPAGRGRERRPAGGVLPLRRLQPLDGRESRTARTPCARSATPTSSAPTAPGGGKFRPPAELADAVAAQWPASPTAAPDRLSSAPAASRCCSSTPRSSRPARAGVRDRRRDQRHPLPPDGIDWICVSPKAARHRLLRGDELSSSIPQARRHPERFDDADFDHFYLQPMDGPDLERNTAPPSSTAWRTRSGGSASRPTRSSGSADDGDLQGVHVRGSAPPAVRPARAQVRPAARPLVPGRSARRGPVDESSAGSWTSPTSRTPSSRSTTNSTTIT